ncbi:serine protease 1-like [Bactrocera neohumeralis]|uniref:serine protease 1-like n=1 Tax=Bactrocera tryoni TaxID=59916 RepID=UPI001A99A21F|nr:serine protease 1-like [Bactrocera tryoni]XP_050333530.1 serine protease 1-like [Bactrocera neohumeralis]
MKFFIAFALCIAAASAYTVGSPVLAATDGINGRITNGERAAAGQFPYQVGLSLKKSIFSSSWCGGSLISSEWVLTAAHCTDGIAEITVYLGATVRTSPEVKYTVSKDNVIIHSGWNSKKIVNDISLIRIPATSFTSKISAVKLPSIASTYSSYSGDRVVASGWGLTSDSASSVSSNLMYATLEIVSNTVCSRIYGTSSVKASNVCVSTPNGVSTCSGDSGGPLVLESSKIQVGLTSYGAADGCELGYPAAFTRITSYLDWIKEHSGVEH